jgi:hypothetical protein
MKPTVVAPYSADVLNFRLPPGAERLFLIPLCPESAARSARNIAAWREYLPTDCVRTMIRMGWDYST